MDKKTISILLIVLLPVLFGSSCSSGEVLIQPKLTGKEKVLSKVSGDACGVHLQPLAYSVLPGIPIMLNSRISRAISDALLRAPGAFALNQITLSENWFWTPIGSFRCLTITGDALQ